MVFDAMAAQQVGKHMQQKGLDQELLLEVCLWKFGQALMVMCRRGHGRFF